MLFEMDGSVLEDQGSFARRFRHRRVGVERIRDILHVGVAVEVGFGGQIHPRRDPGRTLSPDRGLARFFLRNILRIAPESDTFKIQTNRFYVPQQCGEEGSRFESGAVPPL